ncbi:Emp24/gp25L/p24 family protein [Oesophagostomum dentatum]|uniref:Emp24/gp25L/p24 family protein n=1 Tax=Oesophagostomum dentatum TaxID=61180 RepID=A0A0B1TNX3_OESDE|nr:Emp24/gp25L/p24 family protein [Oesophagostomum dentatum]
MMGTPFGVQDERFEELGSSLDIEKRKKCCLSSLKVERKQLGGYPSFEFPGLANLLKSFRSGMVKAVYGRQLSGGSIRILAEEPGVYKFVFDNTHSRLRSKTVRYCIEVEK